MLLSTGQLKSVVIKNHITGEDGLDIIDLTTELQVFTSIEVPFKSGKLLITDGRGLLDTLRIVGGEIITVLIETSDINGESKMIQSTFIVNGIESVQRTSNNNVYLLSLSSIYMYKNMYTRISEYFSGKTSDAIQQILVRTMRGLTAKSEDDAIDNMMYIEESKDNMSFIVPNKRLAEALIWIRNKSRSETNTPFYIYELIDNSMVYMSYGSIIKTEPIATYTKFDTLSTDAQNTYYEIKSFHINKTPNTYENITSGMYASKTFAYDLNTKEVKIEEFNVNDYQDPTLIMNNEGVNTGIMFDGKGPDEVSDVMHNFIFSTTYNVSEDQSTVDNSLDETDLHVDAEKYLPFIQSKRQQIAQHQITCGVIGNVNLYPGTMIEIQIPTSELPQVGEDNLDKSLSGKYMLTNIKHVFTTVKHTTLFECVKDSYA